MRPAAVLFDMDGVLVRSEDVWFRLLEEAGRRFRGRPVERAEFAPTFGQGTAADVSAFGFGCTPAELDAFYQANFFRYLEAVWVDPDARGLLEQLRRAGQRCAVVTNTVTPLAMKILESAGLLGCVEAVLGADLVAEAKPAPDLVWAALGAVRASPEAAWMVGDSRFDAAAAQAANVRFVGYRLAAPLRIETLRELPALWERALS